MRPSSSAHSMLSRAALALPDAVSASVFLLLWIAPFALGPDGVRNALLMMLVEFLLIQGFATSTFFLILTMVMLDVVAGFIVTIIASRRDFDMGAG